jgi:1L-myo-inositol 1-phosphate cytidylyltransferase
MRKRASPPNDRRAISPGTESQPLKGLIVAAGQGTRLRQVAASKPLALVNGVALIEHVITTAHSAGISEFVVVTGYEGAKLETFLQRLSVRTAIPIVTVRNFAWERANGVSVVAAEPHLGDRFVLMMADHLVEPSLISDLMDAPLGADDVVLAIDRRLDNPLVDLADVTRVRTDAGGRIVDIGKMIEFYDAFDTGVFLASRGLIDAIRDDIAAGGSGGISGGMMRLAAQGRAWTFDIGERFWLDVDDPTAHGQAERLRA